MLVHEMPLGGGGGVLPVPACGTVTLAEPADPVTVYVQFTGDVEVLAGMLSCQLVPLPATELFFVQETVAPQLLDTVTLPPLAGNDVGEAATVQDGFVVPPLQLIVTLLAESTLDVQLPPLMVIVTPSEGVGMTIQADETAAASTRLTDRNMCMAYLEKRRRLAAMAQRKRCAKLSTNSRFF
jgi:hypothetical protein